jgi:acetyl-CoA acetyltransferase
MREVAIVGAAMTKFGRYPDKEAVDLAAEATQEALRDAGVTINDVELVVSGNYYEAQMCPGQHLMRQIGATGVPVLNVINACATGSTALREGYLAVALGQHDVVLVVGSEQMGKMGLLGAGMGNPDYNPEGVMGTGLMPGVFAQNGVEHMRKYGTKPEHFAAIAVKNHKHSAQNPYAQYQVQPTLEEVMNARMVAWPNTLYMCCPTGDGAAALLLMSAEKARQYTQKPVWIAASVLTSDPWSPRNPELWDINALTKRAAIEAYETAGIGPEEIDLVELHDCFATAELVHYENLMLCPEGEAARLIEDKETYIGGRIPVAPSGGLLSKGHPIGATGVANAVEVVWHLRDEAGTRQVENAKAGLAHVIGLGSACTINILKR